MNANKPLALRRLVRAASVAIPAVGLLVWLSCSDVWMPEGSSTISRWRADEIGKYCAYYPEWKGGETWRPSAALVRESEAGLAAHLAARQRSGLPMPQEAPAEQPFRYHHQYLGLVLGGERVLFINAYPFYHDKALNDQGFQLLERPECVADGGRHYWRVIYHPASRSFSRLEFNGPA